MNSKVSPTPQVISPTAETYLALYLRHLQTNPLRTKSVTSGCLSALAELIASYLAGEKGPNGSYLTDRVPKMAIYGSMVSAPMGHILVSLLQRAFAGKTTTRDKILQIIASNLIISPIQNVVYLSCMAVIAGAKSFDQVKATVKAGFLPIMRVSLVTSPLTLTFAQRYLPPHAWVPFFNIVGFFCEYLYKHDDQEAATSCPASGHLFYNGNV